LAAVGRGRRGRTGQDLMSCPIIAASEIIYYAADYLSVVLSALQSVV